MALGPADNIIPPTHEQPIADRGDFSQAWSRHNQDVADRINSVRRGVVDGTDAKAGDIGEYLTAGLASVLLTSNVVTAIGSLALPAGDWDVSGQVAFAMTAGANLLQAWVTDVAAIPLDPSRVILVSASVFGTGTRLVTGSQRFLKAAPAPIYLGAFATFGSGAVSASGTIKARRMR